MWRGILNAMMTKWEIKMNWWETKAMAVKRREGCISARCVMVVLVLGV